MKTLYFDCFAGASGDMILGALAAAGADTDELLAQLATLRIENYSIRFDRVDRSGISAIKASVTVPHEHAHRHLHHITHIIEESGLSSGVKDRATRIFTRLAEAEARVHNIPAGKVHFHEVGAMDAILDVAGACVGFELLGVDRFLASELHVGSGMVEMEHGRFPVPPPAVEELTRGVPVYSTGLKGELLTPTGGAIITTVAEGYGPLPQMRVTAAGYGAGTRDYDGFPNVLRVMIGEEGSTDADRVVVIETNVDDLSPQVIGHLMDRAFDLGALDCYLTPVQMKKSRPGVLVTILARPADRTKLTELLFAETTTLGVRACEADRVCLEREIVTVETPFGPIDVKVGRQGSRVVNAMPEYEQCREAAGRAGVALREVVTAAQIAFASRQR